MKRELLEIALEEALRNVADEREKTATILEAMGDAISIQDTELKVLFQNRAHKDLVGDHLGEFCYTAYQGKQQVCDGCHLVESFKDGKVHRRETSTVNEQHGKVWVEIISSALRDAAGKTVAGIEMVRNITARKEAEEKFREMNAELTLRARELAASNSELESFSFSVSHDLRTPLTRIYGASQALEEYAHLLDDNGRYFVQTITDACEQMEGLIDSLLMLSQVTRCEMNREQVNLSLMAEVIVAELRQNEPERTVEVVIAPELTASGDRQLLRVALENLLGNAWKYTRKSTDQMIEFGDIEKEGYTVYFVRDNGAGFDMRYADNLFTPFKRLHSASDFPGTGVGLATVQRIVQRHQGTVWAEGEPGKGATFYFTLES